MIRSNFRNIATAITFNNDVRPGNQAILKTTFLLPKLPVVATRQAGLAAVSESCSLTLDLAAVLAFVYLSGPSAMLPARSLRQIQEGQT